MRKNDLIRLLEQYYINYKKSNMIPHNILILKKDCENCITQHPYDSEILIRFALALYIGPFNSLDESIRYLTCFLNHYSDSSIALLLAYLQDIWVDGVDAVLFKKLCALEICNKEMQSMIELSKSWYYKKNDKNEYEQSLLNAIEFFPDYVQHYIDLGTYYFEQNKIVQARAALRMGLKNIKGPITEQLLYDDINPKSFFRHYVQNNYPNHVVIDVIEKMLKD